MKPIAKIFASLFGSEPFDQESARSRPLRREWDRQRARAVTPAEREEIDAIFSRYL